MIELLKPIFKGPLAAYGEGLICSPQIPPNAVRLSELLDQPSRILKLLEQRANFLGISDLRPAASVWMLNYSGLLMPSVMIATSLLKHALPMEAKDIAIDLDPHGKPTAVIIPHQGESAAGQDSASRYQPLIDTQLTPLIQLLSEQSKLPRKILWGSVARRMDAIFDQLLTFMQGSPLGTQISTDRDYLLQQARWSNGQPNPLFSRQKIVLHQHADGSQTELKLHRQCCLLYRLPGEDYCAACPLSPEFRPAKPNAN